MVGQSLAGQSSGGEEEQPEPGRGRGRDRLPDRRPRLAAVRGSNVRLPVEKFRPGYFEPLRGRRVRAFGPAVRVRGPDSRAEGSQRQVLQAREESGTVEGVEGREPQVGECLRARERGERRVRGGHRLRRVAARRYAVQLQGLPVPEEGRQVGVEAGEEQIRRGQQANLAARRDLWNRAQGLQVDQS